MIVNYRFSLWLMPQETDAAWLQKIIDAFAQANNAPRFAAHMTLLSCGLADKPDFEMALGPFADSLSSFSLEIAASEAGDSFFKSVFPRLKMSDQLKNAYDRVKKVLPPHPGYRLMPHVSLLYCDSPLPKKKAIAATAAYSNKSILFDALAVMMPEDPQGSSWTPVESWRIPFLKKILS